MAVQDLVLHFIYDEESGGKQFYLPGDLLRGTIQLHLRRNLRVRTLTLLILGGAAVSWEQPMKKKLYTAREEYLQGKLGISRVSFVFLFFVVVVFCLFFN